MPVIECSNGKWKIGSGACIYDTKEKATEVWQAIVANMAADSNKVSYDYDGVLSTAAGKAKAERDIKAGKTVYIISARGSVDNMLGTAEKLGIPKSRVYATGSNEAKIEKVKSLNIGTHNDNNPDVIKELAGIGKIFSS